MSTVSGTRAFAEPSLEERLRDRLLLYVRLLRLPSNEGLELVLGTMLDLAPLGTLESSDEELMGRAMALLKKKAEERGLNPEAPRELFYPSVPPYCRGSMPPAKISITESGTGLRNLFRRLKGVFR